MKAGLLLLLCWLPVQDGARAGAERAYREGRYGEARLHYLSLLQRGPDGRIEYNLGNCAFRAGDHARALWRYERARRLLGDGPRIRFNRALASRKLGIPAGLEPGLLEGLFERVEEWGPCTWFLLGLALEAGGLLLLLLFLRRRRALRGILALCLLGLALPALLGSLKASEGGIQGVVVFEDRTPLRSEPLADREATAWLPAGQTARFLSKTPDWVQIRIRDRKGDREGWVPRSRVGLY